jgi:hypothetical protein
VNAKEAIGMLVAGKAGAKEPYTRQDLKYDLATQVIKLVSTNTADPDDPDELDRATIAASTFISAGLRDEVNIGPIPLGHLVCHALSPKRETKNPLPFFSRPLIRGGYTISATNQGSRKKWQRVLLLPFLGRGRDMQTSMLDLQLARPRERIKQIESLRLLLCLLVGVRRCGGGLGKQSRLTRQLPSRSGRGGGWSERTVPIKRS